MRIAGPERVEPLCVAVRGGDERGTAERASSVVLVLKLGANWVCIQPVIPVKYLFRILSSEQGWKSFTGVAADAICVREDSASICQSVNEGRRVPRVAIAAEVVGA